MDVIEVNVETGEVASRPYTPEELAEIASRPAPEPVVERKPTIEELLAQLKALQAQIEALK